MNGIGDEQRIQASQKRRDEMFSAGNTASDFAKAKRRLVTQRKCTAKESQGYVRQRLCYTVRLDATEEK